MDRGGGHGVSHLLAIGVARAAPLGLGHGARQEGERESDEGSRLGIVHGWGSSFGLPSFLGSKLPDTTPRGGSWNHSGAKRLHFAWPST